MKIEVTGVDGILSKLELFVIHNEEKLSFDVNSFDKKRFEKFDVFEHINDYWAILLPHEQDNIFSIYKKIHDVFNTIWEKNKLSLALYPLVAELVDCHDFERIKFWLSFHHNVAVPPADIFKEEYIPNEEKTSTREQTYILSEFFDIRTLSFILRSVIPIWGEYLSRTKKESGTAYKEYYAYQLLCNSQLINSEPMQRLGIYIENSLGQDKAKNVAIFSGISSEIYPAWLTGLVLVRRLCTGDFRGKEPKAHLVALLHKYVSHKVNGQENNYATVINPKIFKEGDGESNNLSRLEQYKIKQELAAGDVVVMEFIFSNIEKLAKKLAPSMDMSLLTSALKTTAKLNDCVISNHQIVLVQWVLKHVIPPKSILYISKSTVVRAIALTQAVLLHRGHVFLAAVVSAIEVSDKDIFSVAADESRARIPKEIADELNIIYPHYKRSASKQKMLKPINQAVLSIDILTDMITLNVWRPTIDPKYYQQTHKWIQIPHDIKIKVATLCLEIGKRSWVP